MVLKLLALTAPGASTAELYDDTALFRGNELDIASLVFYLRIPPTTVFSAPSFRATATTGHTQQLWVFRNPNMLPSRMSYTASVSIGIDGSAWVCT